MLWEGKAGVMGIDWGPVGSLCRIKSEEVEAQKDQYLPSAT